MPSTPAVCNFQLTLAGAGSASRVEAAPTAASCFGSDAAELISDKRLNISAFVISPAFRDATNAATWSARLAVSAMVKRAFRWRCALLEGARHNTRVQIAPTLSGVRRGQLCKFRPKHQIEYSRGIAQWTATSVHELHRQQAL